MNGQSLTKDETFVPLMVDFLLHNEGNYLEVGVYDGVNLCSIGEKVQAKMCYGVDPFIADGWTHVPGSPKPVAGVSLENQKRNTLANIAGKTNIHLFQMTSAEFFANHSNNLNISVVYVDGSHLYSDVLLDLRGALSVIGSKKGLIVVDDIWMPDVKRALEEVFGEVKSVYESSTIQHLSS